MIRVIDFKAIAPCTLQSANRNCQPQVLQVSYKVLQAIQWNNRSPGTAAELVHRDVRTNRRSDAKCARPKMHDLYYRYATSIAIDTTAWHDPSAVSQKRGSIVIA